MDILMYGRMVQPLAFMTAQYVTLYMYELCQCMYYILYYCHLGVTVTNESCSNYIAHLPQH